MEITILMIAAGLIGALAGFYAGTVFAIWDTERTVDMTLRKRGGGR